MSRALSGTSATKPAGGGWGGGEDKAKIILCGQGSTGDGQRAGGAHGKGIQPSIGGTRKLFRGVKLLGALQDHLTESNGWSAGTGDRGGGGGKEEERAGQAALGGHSTPSGLYLRTQRQPQNAVGTRMGVQSREVVLQDSGEELMIAQTWW